MITSKESQTSDQQIHQELKNQESWRRAEPETLNMKVKKIQISNKNSNSDQQRPHEFPPCPPQDLKNQESSTKEERNPKPQP